MKNKIFFNALQFDSSGAGISKYSGKLLEYYLKMYDNIDILIKNNELNSYGSKNIIRCKKDINTSKQRILEEQIFLSSLLDRYNLIHYPDYALPILCRRPCIVTIHDLAMYSSSNTYTKSQVITKRFFMNFTVKKAHKFICISNFTAKELNKYYENIDTDKIEVIYNGIDYKPYKISQQDILVTKNKFKINKPYILFVGTLSPSKNIHRLIKAFNNLKKQGYDYQLIIAGKKGWLYENLFQLVSKLKLDKEVIFTGYVSDSELEVLYNKCEFCSFISLYEGFGFPPLEAMARQKPVLVSNIASIPEVVGNAGLYCNPYSTSDITKKMIKLINDNNLKSSLIKRGVLRVKSFSWDKTANNTYKVYEKVLKDLYDNKGVF